MLYLVKNKAIKKVVLLFTKLQMKVFFPRVRRKGEGKHKGLDEELKEIMWWMGWKKKKQELN